MADDPHELHYASDRRRWRRRVTMIALVLSALACGIVGRLLYPRVADNLRHRGELLAAQRAILALPAAGQSFAMRVVTFADPPTQPASNAAIDAAANRYLAAAYGATSPFVTVYAGTLVDAGGQSRIVHVGLDGSVPWSSVGTITLAAHCAIPATRFTEPPPPPPTILPMQTFREAFSLEPPTLDPNDPRRVLFHGTVDGRAFAYELTVDVNGRATLAPIAAPASRQSN